MKQSHYLSKPQAVLAQVKLLANIQDFIANP